MKTLKFESRLQKFNLGRQWEIQAEMRRKGIWVDLGWQLKVHSGLESEKSYRKKSEYL